MAQRAKTADVETATEVSIQECPAIGDQSIANVLPQVPVFRVAVPQNVRNTGGLEGERREYRLVRRNELFLATRFAQRATPLAASRKTSVNSASSGSRDSKSERSCLKSGRSRSEPIEHGPQRSDPRLRIRRKNREIRYLLPVAGLGSGIHQNNVAVLGIKIYRYLVSSSRSYRSFSHSRQHMLCGSEQFLVDDRKVSLKTEDSS